MPSFAAELTSLENVRANNITALVLDGKTEFNNITGRVQEEANPVVSS